MIFKKEKKKKDSETKEVGGKIWKPERQMKLYFLEHTWFVEKDKI